MFKFHFMVLALSRNASHMHTAKLRVMINKKLYVELLFIEKKEKRMQCHSVSEGCYINALLIIYMGHRDGHCMS